MDVSCGLFYADGGSMHATVSCEFLVVIYGLFPLVFIILLTSIFGDASILHINVCIKISGL